MRRPTTRLLALIVAAATAALVPRAAVFSQPSNPACLDFDLRDLERAVAESDIVVLGTVHTEHDGGTALIEPEAFLKGPATAAPIRPRQSAANQACPAAVLEDGGRVLALLSVREGTPDWPSAGRVFWLNDDRAVHGGEFGGVITESALIDRVRSLTNQFAVPAASQGEGAAIDWTKTVVPVTVALLVVLAIGLVLMRTWHRIDPS